MKNLREYKGYFGSVSYSEEDEVYYGRIEYIRDLVSYEGDDIESLENNFKEAVDDYSEFTKERDIEPVKSSIGRFNVETSSDIYQKATFLAQEKGIDLNKLVNEALEEYLGCRP